MFYNVLFYLYKYCVKRASFRWVMFKIINVFDGGQLYSKLLRNIFKEYYGVDIGMYTHGGCFTPGNIDRNTTIGRYCSIGGLARVINSNHPMEYKSTSALFFNPIFGMVTNDDIEYIPLIIGHDVWIGYNAIVLPDVYEIGTGAVIGAGAVVNKNVPPYAVVVGNPARIVKYRFEKDVIEKLLKSKWWEKSIEELKPHIREFQQFTANLNLRQKDGLE